MMKGLELAREKWGRPVRVCMQKRTHFWRQLDGELLQLAQRYVCKPSRYDVQEQRFSSTLCVVVCQRYLAPGRSKARYACPMTKWHCDL